MVRILRQTSTRPRFGPRVAGVILLVLSGLGLVLGLLLIEALTRDFRASVEVSRSAVVAVGETVAVFRDVAEGTSNSIEAATRSTSSASETARGAATGLEEVADFLDTTLPEDIEAIRMAMPGAIGAADAIDRTLRAVSFFGVDYAPEEPFGDSLRRVDRALAGLPDEIRAQSSSLRDVIPSATALAGDVEDLSVALEDLNVGLREIDDLTDSYAGTVAQAEAAIETTGSSLDRTTWLLRALTVVAALGGAVVGLTFLSLPWSVEDVEVVRPALPARVKTVD